MKKAFKALAVALFTAATLLMTSCIMNFEPIPEDNSKGTVIITNYSTRYDIIKVEFRKYGNFTWKEPATGYTFYDGSCSFKLVSGDYKIRVTDDYYNSYTCDITVIANTTTYLNYTGSKFYES